MSRPLAYETVEELQAAIDGYFDNKCKPDVVDGKIILNPPTVSGLALHLGFADRASIYDYKAREVFSHTIKRAIGRIEEYAEKQLLSGNHATGAIFWLKNKGWSDKQEVDHTSSDGSMKPTVVQLVGKDDES